MEKKDIFGWIRKRVDEKKGENTDSWLWLTDEEKEIRQMKYTIDAIIEYLELTNLSL